MLEVAARKRKANGEWQMLASVRISAGGIAQMPNPADRQRIKLLAPAVLLESGFAFHDGRCARLEHFGAFEWVTQLRRERSDHGTARARGRPAARAAPAAAPPFDGIRTIQRVPPDCGAFWTLVTLAPADAVPPQHLG